MINYWHSNFFGSDGEKNFDLDTYYLSDNGKIKTSADSNSKKIFILGYAHGIIDYRLSLEGNKSYFGPNIFALRTLILLSNSDALILISIFLEDVVLDLEYLLPHNIFLVKISS